MTVSFLMNLVKFCPAVRDLVKSVVATVAVGSTQGFPQSRLPLYTHFIDILFRAASLLAALRIDGLCLGGMA